MGPNCSLLLNSPTCTVSALPEIADVEGALLFEQIFIPSFIQTEFAFPLDPWPSSFTPF